MKKIFFIALIATVYGLFFLGCRAARSLSEAIYWRADNQGWILMKNEKNLV